MIKRSRVTVISIITFIIIACYVFQLMTYQVTLGDYYSSVSSKSAVGNVDIIAPRGEILDRYGRVLATNTVGYSIILERSYFPSSKDIKKQNDELLELTNIITQSGGTVDDSLPVSTTAPYQYTAASSKQIAALAKLVNSDLSKGMTKLPDNATADAVMNALKKIYKTDGYSEAQQRTLCGIHYQMLAKAFSYYNTYTFAENVSLDAITKIQERSENLPGTVVQQVPIRNYPDGTVAPHVIGLTGSIDATDLKTYNKSTGYSPDDLIGKSGIEKSEEKYLHGTNGVMQIETNNSGDVSGTSISTQPKPGDNVVLTIDKNLQVTLQNQLPQIIAQIKAASATAENHAGADAKGAAAVVLDVKTGEVLAMATYPSYDLNSYKQNYKALNSDKTSPLLDRCVQGTYAPGSTFKPIVATSALMNGVITKDTSYDLKASITLGSGPTAWTGNDDEHEARSNVNVIKALEVSSNIFFFEVGMTLGITKLDATAKAYGLGQKTGIELSENVGQMSGPDVKGSTWYQADTAQSSIGQFETLISPVQLANYVSTLVKGGTRYQVHVVKQINSYDNTKVVVNNSTPTVVSKMDIPSDVVDTIKQGMLAVTEGNEGTAASVFKNFNIQIGGKTGTAQITKTSYNGVFICFAPYNDPEIAIATVVEYGHNGFQTAPAAKAAIQQYFGADQNGNIPTTQVSAQKLGALIQ